MRRLHSSRRTLQAQRIAFMSDGMRAQLVAIPVCAKLGEASWRMH